MVDANRPSSSNDDGGASPYSTGGGGVTLEHLFDATVLAALLLGDPTRGLGDEQTVAGVTFQARRFSAVDDLLIFGEPRGQMGGTGRQLAIGVRRNPGIGPGDSSFLALLSDYLLEVDQHWDAIRTGRLRLGVAVAGPNTGVQELGTLAGFARSNPSDAGFRDAVATPKATTVKVRQRLDLLDKAVAKAALDAGIGLPQGGVSELTWRLLTGLHVIDVRLEDDDADRTATVARLRVLAAEPAAASGLFNELARLASRYARAGASVDETTLRRDLSGVAPIVRSASYAKAWGILDTLDAHIRNSTGHSLVGGPGNPTLTLARTAPRDRLIEAMRTAASDGTPLVITGEPDIGKSALTVSAADALRSEGNAVQALSLADLPESLLGLTADLGATLGAVLGSLATAPVRLLVVDGAEAVLQGRNGVLRALADAAHQAGVGLIAITRLDACDQVVEAVCPQGDAVAESVTQVAVEGLADDDVTALIAAFPKLARIASEPRSAWLVQRLGLVDLLLRADAIAALPDGALSEADVFNAVWTKLVRNSERNDRGRGSPDGRELALLELARLQFDASARNRWVGDPQALPALRSDGLLRSAGPFTAWSLGDQFSSDLVRDFAVARLLYLENFSSLREGGSPRWALRAARLACQAKILSAGSHLEPVLSELQEIFENLAGHYGDRWREVPLEAVLTLGSPQNALNQVWGLLSSDRGRTLGTLLRMVLQRFAVGYAADPVIVEPVVQLLTDHTTELRHLGREIEKAAGDVALRWLWGLALRGSQDTPHPLRARLRDQLLAGQLPWKDDVRHECLALMGPNLDAATEDYLRHIARDTPHALDDCVESVAAAISLASHRPELLLELAEAYYIERPAPEAPWYVDIDEGVRHHQYVGLGQPMAGWNRGPFCQLLRAHTVSAVRFINRLLDHAAEMRIRQTADLGPDHMVPELTRGTGGSAGKLPGIELELPDVGRRRFIGDSHAWSWYRGCTVGPYPCMSALLAVERATDQLIAQGMNLRSIGALLLGECQNLAMAGLVYGLLVRHLDKVTDELDPWLSEPDVWRLEIARKVQDSAGPHIQGPDSDDVKGRENRSMSPHDVAMILVLKAMHKGDQDRLNRLRQMAGALVEKFQSEERVIADRRSDEERDNAVKNWASCLDPGNYEEVELPDGQKGIKYNPPEIDEAAAKRQADFERGMDILRLQNVYALQPMRPAPSLEALAHDLRLAIDLSTDVPEEALHFAGIAFAALSCTVLIACVDGSFTPDDDGLQWSAGIALEAAFSTPAPEVYDPGVFSMGADRSAALAIPCLLLPGFHEDAPDLLGSGDADLIQQGLLRVATSGSGEVRRRAALSLERVWQAPCHLIGPSGECRHVIALKAVEASLRDCQVGPFDVETQSRPILKIEGQLVAGLDAISVKYLLVSRLVAPIIALSTLAASGCCVSETAVPLRNAVLRTHAKGAGYWSRKNHGIDHEPEVALMLAECMLHSVAGTDPAAFLGYLDDLRSSPIALQLFLRSLLTVVTYDPVLKVNLERTWPAIMSRALDAATQRGLAVNAADRDELRDWGRALAQLIPSPHPKLDDLSPATTLEGIKGQWIGVLVVEPQLDRWLALAAGDPDCVDSLIGFLNTAPMAIQATIGFDWVTHLIDERYANVASRTWTLLEWLEEIQASGLLDAHRQAALHRLVDGLAAQGDTRAARLQ